MAKPHGEGNRKARTVNGGHRDAATRAIGRDLLTRLNVEAEIELSTTVVEGMAKAAEEIAKILETNDHAGIFNKLLDEMIRARRTRGLSPRCRGDL